MVRKKLKLKLLSTKIGDKRIVDDMHAQLKVRADDVVINLVEVAKENWSFGGGIAQYVT